MSDSNSTSAGSSDSYDEDEICNDMASSSSSSDSSDDGLQNDTLELAKIGNELLKLPRGLCENAAVFREFFSMETWQLFSESFKTYLMNKHLPAFQHLNRADDRAEKEKTVDMLFSYKIFRFGKSPLLELQRNLEEGNYRPDVLKLRRSITKSQKRERRFQTCERISQMAKQLFISRERLLRKAYSASDPSEAAFRTYKPLRRSHAQLQMDSSMSTVRARKRFLNEVKCIALQCGYDKLTDEEDDLAVDLNKESHRDTRRCDSAEGTSASKITSTSEKCIYSTQFKRKHDVADEDTARAQYESKQPKLTNRTFKHYLREHKRRKTMEPNLPEYDTLDIRLREVYARAQVGGNFKCVFASGKTPGRKPKSKLKTLISSLPTIPSNNKMDKSIDEDKASVSNADKAQIAPSSLDSEKSKISADSKMQNFVQSTKYPAHGPSVIRKEQDLQNLEMQSSHGYSTVGEEAIPTFIITNETMLPPLAKKEHTKSHNIWHEKLNYPSSQKVVTSTTKVSSDTVKFESLCKPQAMNIAPSAPHKSLGDGPGRNKVIQANSFEPPPHQSTILQNPAIKTTSNPELIQETHTSFFSLLRDLFCATLNHRMNLDELREKIRAWLLYPITALNDWYSLAENWSSLLSSAIQFLAGDFAEQPEEYVPYIEYKKQQNYYQWIGAGRDSDARLLELFQYWLSHREKISEQVIEQKSDTTLNTSRRHSTECEDTSAYERGLSPPPPPRCPTTWTVTPATQSEVAEFQRQERERFENPHRAYTYRMHGYESVVGPVKGIYSQILALSKARGHSMMIGDRPNFVTILTLVRDATARLPNGEGTRADISELLKCSQYINQEAAENVLQTIVSGALDRMHTEHDPCVRYDPKRKIWIYLHRNRTEEEFERMHQQYQGLGKHKKPLNRKTKPSKGSKDSLDVDIVSSLSSTGASLVTTSGPNNVYSLPALVPANPVIVNAAFNQSIKQAQQQHQLPPVPPLKYNIQPQQQQKSLLKTSFQPIRGGDMKPADSNSTDYGIVRVAQPMPKLISTSLIGPPNKSVNFSVTPAATTKTTNIVSTPNTTPVIVSTPTGLKTVHVSNATSVSSTNSNAGAQFVKSDLHQGTTHTSPLNATVGGKKVALNKPIIINQITQQIQNKNKSSQSPHKQQSQQQQEQLQKQQQIKQQQQQQQDKLQSFLTTQMHTTQAGNADKIKFIAPISVDDIQIATRGTKSNQTGFVEKSKLENSEAQSKNILRIFHNSGKDGKTLITVPVATSTKQPVQMVGQRVLTNATTSRAQLVQKQVGGISLITATSNSSCCPPSVASGTVVKMSSQALASLQQKPSQQQHVLLKPTNTATVQQRVVMGKPVSSVNPSTATSKNLILQTLSATATSSPKAVLSSPCTNVSSKSTTPVLNVSPHLPHTKDQTMNSSNPITQRQKVLLQNFKQQSVQQFKAVQVLSNTSQQQQNQQTQSPAVRLTASGNQALRTVSVNAAGQLLKPNVSPHTKTVVVSQPQNLACFLKATNASGAPGTEVKTLNSATGQLISIEGLMGKQGSTLRVTNAAAGNAKTAAQVNNIVQLISNTGQQQDATQYSVLSSHSRNITFGNSHQLHSSQASGAPASVFTTSVAIPVAQAKDSGGKVGISTRQSQDPSNAASTRMVSPGCSTSSTSAPFKIITTGGIGATLNLANLQGKQVVLARKPATINQGQKQQNSAVILGGPMAKLQQTNPTVKLLGKKTTSPPKANTSHVQTVLVGNQLIRIDQLPAAVKQQLQQQTSRITVSSMSTTPAANTSVSFNTTGTTVLMNSNDSMVQPSTDNMPKAYILGSSGQKIRFQTPSAQQTAVNRNDVVAADAQKNTAVKPPPSRVVLAVQGLKSLQNVKIMPVSPAQQVLPSVDAEHHERTSKVSPQELMLRH